MLTVHRLLLFLTLLVLTPLAFATVAAPENRANCINGDVSNNKSLLASMDTNKDPLRLEFLKSLETNKSETAPTTADSEYNPITMKDFEACFQTDANIKNMSFLRQLSKRLDNISPNLEAASSSEAQKDFAEVSKHSTPKSMASKIKRECIAASMTRAPGNDGYTCSYPTAKQAKTGSPNNSQNVITPYGTAGGNSLQCVNDRMVDYMTFAVNSAIQCMSPDDPIDTRVIFKKINNETAFNPSIAYTGGVGIGQTTSPAKNELTDKDLGRGRYVLEGIVNSKKPECNGFRKVAESDLNRAPAVRNSCDWVNPGNGLARSLMYTVGYYLTMRDQYIIPLLEKRSPHLIENSGLVNDFTAISYGGEGLEKARLLMQKYRAGKGTNAKDLQEKIRRDSRYLKSMKSKMKEFTCIRKNIDPNSKECEKQKHTPEDLEAESCVTH